MRRHDRGPDDSEAGPSSSNSMPVLDNTITLDDTNNDEDVDVEVSDDEYQDAAEPMDKISSPDPASNLCFLTTLVTRLLLESSSEKIQVVTLE